MYVNLSRAKYFLKYLLTYCCIVSVVVFLFSYWIRLYLVSEHQRVDNQVLDNHALIIKNAILEDVKLAFNGYKEGICVLHNIDKDHKHDIDLNQQEEVVRDEIKISIINHYRVLHGL